MFFVLIIYIGFYYLIKNWLDCSKKINWIKKIKLA